MNFDKQVNGITDIAYAEYLKSPMYNRTNEDRLKAVGNIYFIFSNNQLKYIGQRSAKQIRVRLDQHLFGKSYSVDNRGVQNGTVSKWDKIKVELDQGNRITFKTILIEPNSLRKTIEVELISRLKPEWNIQKM